MSKKITASVFSDGTVVVADNDKVRKATDKEKADYLAGFLPKKIKGAALKEVKHEDGYVFGRYANGKTYKRPLSQSIKIAQSETKQTEPVNVIDNADDGPEVPRDSSVGFKQHDGKDPEDVREKKYKKGPDAKNLHTSNIPRDKSGDGVGGDSVKFEKEVANDSTSGNPDTYVQDFNPGEKPNPAGKKGNHTASGEKTTITATDSSENIKAAENEKKDEISDKKAESKDLAKAAKSEECKECNCAPCECDKKDKKESKTPWLRSKKKASLENSQSVVSEDKQSEASSQDEQDALLKKENNELRLVAGRQSSAIKLALCLGRFNPDKYASDQDFCDTVANLAKTNTTEAMETFIAESHKALLKKASKNESEIEKQASSDSVLSTAIVVPYDPASSSSIDESLKSLFQRSQLGRMVLAADQYAEQNQGISN